LPDGNAHDDKDKQCTHSPGSPTTHSCVNSRNILFHDAHYARTCAAALIDNLYDEPGKFNACGSMTGISFDFVFQRRATAAGNCGQRSTARR
jgi:hypothetical protein